MRSMLLFIFFVLASSKEIPFKKILRKCSRVLYYKYCENTSCCDYELATVKIGWTLGIVWARRWFFSLGEILLAATVVTGLMCPSVSRNRIFVLLFMRRKILATHACSGKFQSFFAQNI
jgi:hypothetical protein